MPPESWKSKMEKLGDKGIYLLLVYLPFTSKIRVGALGEIEFEEGYYVYVGSAQKNLKRRIERHARKEKKNKWHIDYLLEHAILEDVCVYELSKEYEEIIAKKLGLDYPNIRGFGASDSKAGSHLLYIKDREEWNKICKKLNRGDLF